MTSRRLNIDLISKMFKKYNKDFHDDLETKEECHLKRLKQIFNDFFGIGNAAHIDVLDKVKFSRGNSTLDVNESVPIFLMEVYVKSLNHKTYIVFTWNTRRDEWIVSDIGEDTFKTPNFDVIIENYCEI